MPHAQGEVRTVFLLHFLGGSARQWAPVISHLDPSVRSVCIDLPGFGTRAHEAGKDVAAMAADVAIRIHAEAEGPWWIVGHSMGAKVALAVARQAEDGLTGLEGFSGVAVVAGSPPSPEPMSDAKRAEMVAWIDGDEALRHREARKYIAQNTGAKVDPMLQAFAIEDVLGANPAAWKAWLHHGSREDWCREIGVIRSPALIVSGRADGDLGPATQVALMAPHLACHRHLELAGTGHLIPIEQPRALADAILAFSNDPRQVAVPVTTLPTDYRALIVSDRVNRRLRAALLERGRPDDPIYEPVILDAVELAILRVACSHVIPQVPHDIDLAARIDQRLAADRGDGWRHASLPPDGVAYRLALRGLDAAALASFDRHFVALDSQRVVELLHAIEAKKPARYGGLDAAQMQLWFEELRADVVRIYLAHPLTLARLGFSGIGAGGDDIAKLSGFACPEVGGREAWEPLQNRS